LEGPLREEAPADRPGQIALEGQITLAEKAGYLRGEDVEQLIRKSIQGVYRQQGMRPVAGLQGGCGEEILPMHATGDACGSLGILLGQKALPPPWQKRTATQAKLTATSRSEYPGGREATLLVLENNKELRLQAICCLPPARVAVGWR
jgi:hypothetical protein